jgi:D-alanyl-D-alanine carboxypeptidase/D-alanyl-D-alanine-endopeptidase (penicillin-binding protein 4)
MMRESHNLTAETLVKTMGAQNQEPGTWKNGLAVMRETLGAWGCKEGDYALEDGSGLSRRNRLSPAILTTVLLKMHSSELGAEFVSSMAVAGRSGTLRRRLTITPYKDNVHAKTGYIRGASGLSGYAKTRAGTSVAFSILINDDRGGYSFRELREKICRAVVDKAR